MIKQLKFEESVEVNFASPQHYSSFDIKNYVEGARVLKWDIDKVDFTKLGETEVSISADDKNFVVVFKVIDTRPPVFTNIIKPNEVIEINSIRDLGTKFDVNHYYSAIDASGYCQIKWDGLEAVNVGRVGTYKVYAEAFDASGNVCRATQPITFKVVDTKRPTIALVPMASREIDVNNKDLDFKSFSVDSYAIARDNSLQRSRDMLSWDFEKVVDLKKTGIYKVTITANDGYTEPVKTVVEFHVVDSTNLKTYRKDKVIRPVLHGTFDKVIAPTSEFDLLYGVFATSDYATPEEIEINYEPSEIDFNTPGDYVIYYTAKDPLGNIGHAKMKLEVEEKELPTIKFENDEVLNGVSTKRVNLFEDFNPMEGISAFDQDGNDITCNLLYRGDKLNTAKEGIYTLRYMVSDTHDRIKFCDRNIIVSNMELPTIDIHSNYASVKYLKTNHITLADYSPETFATLMGQRSGEFKMEWVSSDGVPITDGRSISFLKEKEYKFKIRGYDSEGNIIETIDEITFDVKSD